MSNSSSESFEDVDATGNGQGVGLSNPQLSQSRRSMLDLINRLHSTGVQTDMDLPQIAVIGSQSAGKSSLIESISGISLPRAAGTCTRVPTECRLTHSKGNWSCVVSLRITTDAKGRPLGHAKNIRFGDVITDKACVEERIRRAQLAILNPKNNANDFLTVPLEGEQTSQLSFSSNCVSLEISGPDVADLSFCDLPGIIRTASGTTQTTDIELVENLIRSYIAKPSCVILLTVTCETDFENQGAHRLAKELDPHGRRTIGVLTKPDRIPFGEEQAWIKFIRNEKEPLDNGWFCVKQPDSQELKRGISWKEARRREDQFFSTTAPWSSIDSAYQGSLRTTNLVQRLSMVLSDLIFKRMPEIQDELRRKIEDTRAKILALPPAPSKDSSMEIMLKLNHFVHEVSIHVEGVAGQPGESSGLIQRLRPFIDQFRRDIKRTAPDFRPYELRLASIYDKYMTSPTFLASEEDLFTFEDVGPRAGQPTYVDQVHRMIQSARARELPGHIPFVVTSELISLFTKEWEKPAVLLCEKFNRELETYMDGLISFHFANYGQGLLLQRVKTIVKDHIHRLHEKAQRTVEWQARVESRRAFTTNTRLLQNYQENFMSYFKAIRQTGESSPLPFAFLDRTSSGGLGSSSDTSEPVSQVSTIMQGFLNLNVHGIKPEDLAKVLPPDPMEPSLRIMANVRAYFQVAYKRFVDNIPMTVDEELVYGMQDGLLLSLLQGLHINGPDAYRVCQDLAAESPLNASKREAYMKQLERLQLANDEVLQFN
ncbi:hypothetical protein FISHEDRAFT_33028 [Fistulina hepatica ATCC 64428]|uniref:P-loop containing nucleoside triphosphate hydrolase protein n=1 Tax=Fistulina hepatica ATCC 64428 TaxID=1128425 RepID=A0A0D7AQD5_9AGAR|nr:hypothetical protein FISHEDRAFT_33028 [Fistulina hepatica ATCC 64428]